MNPYSLYFEAASEAQEERGRKRARLELTPIDQKVKREYADQMKALYDEGDDYARSYTSTGAMLQAHLTAKYAKEGFQVTDMEKLRDIFTHLRPPSPVRDKEAAGEIISDTVKQAIKQVIPQRVKDITKAVLGTGKEWAHDAYNQLSDDGKKGVKISLGLAGSLVPDISTPARQKTRDWGILSQRGAQNFGDLVGFAPTIVPAMGAATKVASLTTKVANFTTRAGKAIMASAKVEALDLAGLGKFTKEMNPAKLAERLLNTTKRKENPGVLNAGANDVFNKNMQVIRNTIDQQGDQWLKSSPSLHQPFIEDYIQTLNKVLDKHAIPHTVGNGGVTPGSLNANAVNPLIVQRQEKLLQWANKHHADRVSQKYAQELKTILETPGHPNRGLIGKVIADFEAKKGFFAPLEETPLGKAGRGQKNPTIPDNRSLITTSKVSIRTPEQIQASRETFRKIMARIEEKREIPRPLPRQEIRSLNRVGKPPLMLIDGGKNLAQETVLKVKTRIDRQLFQDHHIISHSNILTKDHKLLELAGFNLQSRANRMLLPTKEGVKVSKTKRSIHYGKHIDLVSKRIAKKMQDALDLGAEVGWSQEQYHTQLVKIISEERKALKSGDRILNINHRPLATDSGRVIPKEPKE